MSKVLYALRILCRTSTINPQSVVVFVLHEYTKKEKREKRFFE